MKILKRKKKDEINDRPQYYQRSEKEHHNNIYYLQYANAQMQNRNWQAQIIIEVKRTTWKSKYLNTRSKLSDSIN